MDESRKFGLDFRSESPFICPRLKWSNAFNSKINPESADYFSKSGIVRYLSLRKLGYDFAVWKQETHQEMR